MSFLAVTARCFILISRSFALGFLLTLLAAWGCYWHLTLRPQTFTWILYPVVILVCERVRNEGLSRWYRAVLAIIVCLWANFHVSTIIPLATIAVLVAREKIGMLVTLLAGCFIATLVTPNFGAEWISAINYAGHPAAFTLISELRPVISLGPWSMPLLRGIYLCCRYK